MNYLTEKTLDTEMKSMIRLKIKNRMRALNISIKDISDRTGIDQRNVSSVLGSRGGLTQLLRIAHSIDLDFSENELELQTSFWIKNKQLFLHFLNSKIEDAFSKGIFRHLDVIRVVEGSFFDEFNLSSERQAYSKDEWENVKLDLLRVITIIVMRKIQNRVEELIPITILCDQRNGEFVFFKSNRNVNSRKETFSVGEFIFSEFRKKYGDSFFYEELIAKSFELGANEYVQEIKTSAGDLLWINNSN